jgi:acyl-homoserine-lactone acylase
MTTPEKKSPAASREKQGDLICAFLSRKNPGTQSVRLKLAALSWFVCASCLFSTAEVVTVRRDIWGIPHISAKTEEAGAFALGYCQAEDRLDQIFRNYRLAAGHMAEAFGRDWIEHDYQQRVVRHETVSKQYVENHMPRDVLRFIEAFQDGIRTYMKENPDRIPSHACEIHPYDAVAVARYVIYGWPLGTIVEELRRGTGRGPRLYSNEWSVMPRRTADNCSVLLIDPHVPWEGVFRFYEHRLEAGDLKVCGFAVVGAPGIGLGHNDHLGWACTTGGPDTADVYEEIRNPKSPWQYRYEETWRDVEVTEEEIRYKDHDGSIKSEKHKIYRTHHGPVIYDTADKLYTAKTAYDDQAGMATQMVRLMHAENREEFVEAMSLLQLMEQNVMGADIDGNIFYIRNGRVPIRPDGFSWNRPVPGDTNKSEWLGVHPLKELVQIINPKTGYMQNCNISPGTMAHEPLVDEKNYRPYVYNADPNGTNSRGLRAVELLSSHERLTKEQALAIVSDTQLPEIDNLHSLLGQIPVGSLSDDVRVLLRQILDWNGRVDADQPGATAFGFLIEGLSDKNVRVSPQSLKSLNQLTEAQIEQVVSVLSDAAKRMRETYESLTVPWGEIHRINQRFITGN